MESSATTVLRGFMRGPQATLVSRGMSVRSHDRTTAAG